VSSAMMSKSLPEVKVMTQPVDTTALAVVEVERPRTPGPQGYEGAGETRLTPEQAKGLMELFKDEEHEIKPTDFGEVYVSHPHIRRRLNTVLGPGQWTLVPVVGKDGGIYFEDKGNTVCYRGRLYIHGNFVSEAVGEQAMASQRMTYASACEGARSDALVRCCKDLSVGWECWDRQWTEGWKKKFAVRVACKVKGETRWGWRKKDGKRLSGEVGVVPHDHEPQDADDPVITKEQVADLWALSTEKFGRKEAETHLREILAKHGFKATGDIKAAKFKAILEAVKALS